MGKSLRTEVWRAMCMRAPGAREAPSQARWGRDTGRAGPPPWLPFEISHSFKWVFSILLPTMEVGNLKESV